MEGGSVNARARLVRDLADFLSDVCPDVTIPGPPSEWEATWASIANQTIDFLADHPDVRLVW